MKKKGLSQEEIDEAMRRANASSTSTTTPAASLPVTQPNTSPVLAATPQQPMPYPPYPQGYAVPPPGQWQPQPLPQQVRTITIRGYSQNRLILLHKQYMPDLFNMLTDNSSLPLFPRLHLGTTASLDCFLLQFPALA